MKKLISMFVLILLTLIPESCLRQPPTVEDMESFVKKNWNEISLVNDYLLELRDKNAYISQDDGSILIDLDHQRIGDDAVMEAIRSLWRDGCSSISKRMHGESVTNAITYTIWTRTVDQISCGFAYAIDYKKSPEIQYQTELVPLSIEGWYYYVSNYEEWRYLQHRNND